MIKASYVAEIASLGKRIGTPYDLLDCQALIEKLLSDAGVDRPNWKGSNDMWRNALSEKHELTAENKKNLLPGAWTFTIKHDGGEKKRGYNDNEGNAAHVGMYLGDGRIIHSTTGGVQWDRIESSRWTHYGLCKLLDYSETQENDSYYRELIEAFDKMKEVLKRWPY